MNITKYIPAVHNWYVAQGEYKCKTCNGSGYDRNKEWKPGDSGHYEWTCTNCDGSDKHKNTGELLAEIAGLLVGDALRAWEKGLVFSSYIWSRLVSKGFYEGYRIHCTSLFENYLAQSFIKLFDLCGWLNCTIQDYIIDISTASIKSIPERLYCIERELPILGQCKNYYQSQLSQVYTDLYHFCKDQNIPIEKHIDCRLQYMGVKV